MTGNVAQVFLTDDWGRALQGIHTALRPGGSLVFEARCPERHAWQEWAVDVDPVTLDVADIGLLERRQEVTDVGLPFVSFRYTYRFLVNVREAPDRPGREFMFVTERSA
nr:class I SAM-dependent methyltransferase [Frankia gtarii]